MADLGTAYIQVRGDLSQFNKQMVANLHPSRLGKLGKTAGVAVGAGLGAGFAAKGLFDVGAQFDKEFDKIRTATGRTGRSLRNLQDDFKDVLRTTPADFDTVGTAVAGLNQRLGLTGRPLQRLSRQLVTLSRITGTDIGENVESITRLFGDWSVKTGDQATQLNKLFRVSQRTGLPISKLSRLMVAFGSPLRQLGFDFETTAAMFGRFEREGVNIQTIMPGFRFALKNLSAPTGEVTEELKRLGLVGESPRKALQGIFEAIKDAPNAMRANALAFTIFGKRAGPDMAAAIREGRFELDSLLRSMSRGDTIQKAGRDTEDFSEKWQRFKNNILVGIEPLATKFFQTVSRDMGRVSRIISDPGLSTEEKWDRIGDVLSDRLESGIDLAAETAARLAPKVASAFVRGFINAPLLIQLVAGAWVFAKGRKLLAAFGLLGTQAGAAMGTGVVTGASGTVGGGAAGGLAGGLAARLTPALRGVGLVGGTVLAISIADKMQRDLIDKADEPGFWDDLKDKVSSGLESITPDLGGGDIEGPGGDQASNINNAIRDLNRNLANPEIIRRFATDLQGLAREYGITGDSIRQFSREVNAQFAIMGRFKGFQLGSAVIEDHKVTRREIRAMKRSLDELPPAARKAGLETIKGMLASLVASGDLPIREFRRIMRRLRGAADTGGTNLVASMAKSFGAVLNVVAASSAGMFPPLNAALKALGADPVKIDAKKFAIGGLKLAGGLGLALTGGKAEGGFIGGRGRKDTVPIMAAPGEAVLNRHQQAPVESALRSTYGYGLDDLFKREQRPHYMAKGGIVGLGRRLQKRGYEVSEHPAFGGVTQGAHVPNSYHYKASALDINDDDARGGEMASLDRLASQLTKQGWHILWRVKNHFDHLHVDTASGVGGVGGLAEVAATIKRLRVEGPDGALRDVTQAAVDKLREAGNAYLGEQGVSLPEDRGAPPGRGGGAAANKRLARSLMRSGFFFPVSEFGALEQLWQGESGWNENAVNPSSGAGGIPQALPASKMGRGWQGDARQQILWGLKYIKERYGTPSRALAAWQSRSPHWYAKGGIVPQMYAGGFLSDAAFRSATEGVNLKDRVGAKLKEKPRNLKKPRKGGPPPGKGYKWDDTAKKWVRRRRRRGDGFDIKQLDFLNAALDRTIPGITDLIQSKQDVFDLTDEEHYPDERVVPRLLREGHNIQKIGDSFIDWSAVEQSKSEIGQLLGDSFRLIGTPFGGPRGVMEMVRDAFPSLQKSVEGLVARLKREVDEIRRRVRENTREINGLDKRIRSERDKKNPDERKIDRWAKDRTKLADENRRLSGERTPDSLENVAEDSALGRRTQRLTDAQTALGDLKDDRESFLGASGIGGDFASQRNNISGLVKQLGELTTERITEAVTPVAPDRNEDLKNFGSALRDLLREFGPNFRPIRAFQRGGIIPGAGTGDKVLAALEPGEGLINRTAVMQMGGPQAIERINKLMPRFQAGGVVASPIQVTAPRGQQQMVVVRQESTERPNVTQNITFQTQPKDAHTFTRSALFELEAAI